MIQMNMIKKFVRYIFLYGLRRSVAKALYRIDNSASYFILRTMYALKRSSDKRIIFVGLGNHGFTLLAFLSCDCSSKN